MDRGLFLDREDFITVDYSKINKEVGIIFIGNYGCLKACPSLNQILKNNSRVNSSGFKLHYISPKLAEDQIYEEFERVCSMIDNNIYISINDWGLLYMLKKEKKLSEKFFMGRMLTTSIINWIMHLFFTKDEDETAKDYLFQNTFNHTYKMNFFKEWDIGGIEVSTFTKSETSYNEIRKNGFKIIGYSDDVILSLSRSCPNRRIRNKSYHCSKDCQNKSKIEPSFQKQKEKFPKMYLKGNIVYGYQQDTPRSKYYDTLVENYKK